MGVRCDMLLLYCFSLKKQLQQHSTCRLHQMLAEFLEHTNDHIEALDHYNIALRYGDLLTHALRYGGPVDTSLKVRGTY